jgi:serine/threonine protein phosphatase PrpC
VKRKIPFKSAVILSFIVSLQSYAWQNADTLTAVASVGGAGIGLLTSKYILARSLGKKIAILNKKLLDTTLSSEEKKALAKKRNRLVYRKELILLSSTAIGGVLGAIAAGKINKQRLFREKALQDNWKALLKHTNSLVTATQTNDGLLTITLARGSHTVGDSSFTYMTEEKNPYNNQKSTVNNLMQKQQAQVPDLFKLDSGGKTYINEFDSMFVGISERQGARPEMEDAVIAHKLPNNTGGVWAVFDGHGGDQVAEFCKEHFIPEVINTVNWSLPDEELHKAICEAYVAFDYQCMTIQKDSGGNPGTTAIVAVYHKPSNRLLIINLGDSRAIVTGENGVIIAATKDHKPENEREKQRIISLDGWVSYGRVAGQLAVARTFGDRSCKRQPEWVDGERHFKKPQYLASPVPDIIAINTKTTNVKGVILACDGIIDGVYDHIKNEDNCNVSIARSFESAFGLPAQEIAENLSKTCIVSGDNVSTVVIKKPLDLFK